MSTSQKKNPDFNVINLKGFYARPIEWDNRKYFKYCKICGYEIRAEKLKLHLHCKANHQNTNEGFLEYGKLPYDCIYQNLENYLKGKVDNPILKSNRGLNKGGRPFKDVFQSEKEEPNYQIPEIFFPPNQKSQDEQIEDTDQKIKIQ